MGQTLGVLSKDEGKQGLRGWGWIEKDRVGPSREFGAHGNLGPVSVWELDSENQRI
jgi:hypothetical protein